MVYGYELEATSTFEQEIFIVFLSCSGGNLSPVFYYQFAYFLPSGSPRVTSLRYDNQSRTLTCTSTGGPATTFTWRRDGVVIILNATYQQTKRVVDPVASTYQTVLTIDPSVDIVGTYNCTVENARGSTSAATLTVAGNGELIDCEC